MPTVNAETLTGDIQSAVMTGTLISAAELIVSVVGTQGYCEFSTTAPSTALPVYTFVGIVSGDIALVNGKLRITLPASSGIILMRDRTIPAILYEVPVTITATAPPSTAQMSINDNGTWKSGTPWVNDNGTWKEAKAVFVHDGTGWKESK